MKPIFYLTESVNKQNNRMLLNGRNSLQGFTVFKNVFYKNVARPSPLFYVYFKHHFLKKITVGKMQNNTTRLNMSPYSIIKSNNRHERKIKRKAFELKYIFFIFKIVSPPKEYIVS